MQRRRPRGACLTQALSPDLACRSGCREVRDECEEILLVGSAGRCVRRGEGRRGERCVVGGGAGGGAGATEGSPPPSWCSVGACLAGLRPPPPSPAWGRRARESVRSDTQATSGLAPGRARARMRLQEGRLLELVAQEEGGS